MSEEEKLLRENNLILKENNEILKEIHSMLRSITMMSKSSQEDLLKALAINLTANLLVNR